MFGKVKFVADAGAVARSIALSAVAIALAVYGMVLRGHGVAVAVLAAIVLLIVAGTVLHVNRAVRQLRGQQDRTRRAAEAAERHYFKVMRRVVAATEARESYTRGRSRRIGHLARRIAERLGLESRLCRLMELAGQVHDIGLLAVPDRILEKPSRLGNEEFHTVKKHAEVSYRILEPLTFLEEVLPAVRYHHERMNGTGYPYELRGEDIPLPARVLAVADAYDAMTHDRPHRAAMSSLEAIEELRRCSPLGYDPKCVEAMEDVLGAGSLRDVYSSKTAGPPSPSVPVGSPSE